MKQNENWRKTLPYFEHTEIDRVSNYLSRLAPRMKFLEKLGFQGMVRTCFHTLFRPCPETPIVCIHESIFYDYQIGDGVLGR